MTLQFFACGLLVFNTQPNWTRDQRNAETIETANMRGFQFLEIFFAINRLIGL